jgi:hypothetical protein
MGLKHNFMGMIVNKGHVRKKSHSTVKAASAGKIFTHPRQRGSKVVRGKITKIIACAYELNRSRKHDCEKTLPQ